MAGTLFNMLKEDGKTIIYRPKLSKILGTTTAILLSQFIFWWDDKPFYKFKEPCTSQGYRQGDSWCEELGFSRNEFDNALKRIGTRVKKDEPRSAVLDIKKIPDIQPGQTKEDHIKAIREIFKSLILYWSDGDRKTWYMVNVPLLEDFLARVYLAKESFLLYLKQETDVAFNAEITTEIKEKENVSPEAKQARARESASDSLSKNEQPQPDDIAKAPLTGYGDDYQIKPTATLEDCQNPFQNKNESGDSVPILDDVCPKCANITHSIVDANGIKSRLCKCKPPDNPTISPTQVWILQKANDINVYVKASHFGSAPKDVEYLHSIGYLRRYKGQTASYIITSQGIQWLKDNPDTTSELSRIEVIRKDTKPKKRIGKKQTPTELSPELQPIADALAQARHNRPFKELLNGNRAGIMKIATQFHADGLIASDVETIQEYFEHKQKTNADGKLIWLTCNYNTYLKHAQDAIDWKKSATQFNPEYLDDGIQNPIDPDAMIP